MLFLRLFLFLIFLSTSAFCAEAAKNTNAHIKQKLKAEVDGLHKDLASLNKSVIALRQDKMTITKQLQEMQAWGNTQQEEKLHYYTLADKFKESLHHTEISLADEKKNNLATLEKYRRIKQVMSVLAGSFLVLLYFKLGASAISSLAGPYGQLVYFLGPVAAFMLGYGITYIFF